MSFQLVIAEKTTIFCKFIDFYYGTRFIALSSRIYNSLFISHNF